MLKLNEKNVEFGQFPNREFNLPIKNLYLLRESMLEFIYQDNDDIVKLMLMKSFLDSMNVKTTLYIYNLPYSRMDRANGHYAVSVDAICALINSLGFQKTIVREPHSNVSMELLKNSVADMWCGQQMTNVLESLKYESVFFPDYGAMNRYKDFASFDEISVAFGAKERDFETGAITSYKVVGDLGKKVLIVDDLCSRGGTFVQASKQLKQRGVEKVSLLVSYCEENVFTGELFDHIEKLFVSKEIPLTAHNQIFGI